MKRLHPDKTSDPEIIDKAIPTNLSHCNYQGNSKYKSLLPEEADTIYKKLLKQNEVRIPNKNAKKPWTDDESRLLFWSIGKYCNEKQIENNSLGTKDWERISSLIPGRNITQCHYKWSINQKHFANKTPWSVEEDNMLTDIISNKALSSWSIIARELNTSLKSYRSGKQCRERWLNHLSPTISK